MKITLYNAEIIEAVGEYVVHRKLIPNKTDCIINVYTRGESQVEIDVIPVSNLDAPIASKGSNTQATA